MPATMPHKKKHKPQRPTALFVELPEDLRGWFESIAKRDGQSFKEKTIRIFEHYRRTESQQDQPNK